MVKVNYALIKQKYSLALQIFSCKMPVGRDKKESIFINKIFLTNYELLFLIVRLSIIIFLIIGNTTLKSINTIFFQRYPFITIYE